MKITVLPPKKSILVKNVENKISETDFLRAHYPSAPGTKLDICSLWHGAYRLNFWGKKVIDTNKIEEDCIVHSIFVRIQKEKDSFKIVMEQIN